MGLFISDEAAKVFGQMLAEADPCMKLVARLQKHDIVEPTTEQNVCPQCKQNGQAWTYSLGERCLDCSGGSLE